MRQLYFPKNKFHIVHKPEDWYIKYDGTVLPIDKIHYYQLSDIRWKLKLGRNHFVWFLKTIGLLGYNNKPNMLSPWFKYIKVILPIEMNWLSPAFFGKENTFISDEGAELLLKEYHRLRKNGANI